MEKCTKMAMLLALFVLGATSLVVSSEARNIKGATGGEMLHPQTFPGFPGFGGTPAFSLPGSSGSPGFSLPGSGSIGSGMPLFGGSPVFGGMPGTPTPSSGDKQAKLP